MYNSIFERNLRWMLCKQLCDYAQNYSKCRDFFSKMIFFENFFSSLSFLKNIYNFGFLNLGYLWAVAYIKPVLQYAKQLLKVSNQTIETFFSDKSAAG